MHSEPVKIEWFGDDSTKVVEDGAQLFQLATGFTFTEGPVWDARNSCLYFSDMPEDKRRRWSEAKGIEVVRSPANKCNGMSYDAAGRLYVCEHVTSRLVRETPDGAVEVLASHWGDKELNSPNDVVVRSDGSVYFSDPTYGRMPGFGLERECELDFRGLYRVSPSGELHLEANDFVQTNGLCFSPDEQLLYVNDSERGHIRRFRVSPSGALGSEDIFAANIVSATSSGVVDGMKCDERGNVFVTGPEGVWVFAPDGKHLGVIHLPEHAGNLTFGGEGWRDLFFCCSTSVYRLRMDVRGHREGYMTGWD